ncbi:hypothetical protein PQR08_37075 [Caballeronia jiangsuensis]|uniref:Uncharacterized protein n=1 Tax=Caballeronia jiangsuensis TaxID=1458357 RepID=A0ABW9CY98_9BURK
MNFQSTNTLVDVGPEFFEQPNLNNAITPMREGSPAIQSKTPWKMKVYLVTAAALIAALNVGTAYAGVQQEFQDFESSRPPAGWIPTGIAGFDYGKGLAHQGEGNSWVRAVRGWNAINKWIRMPKNSDCIARAWIRHSDSLTDGYMTVRGGNGSSFGPVITEVKLSGPNRPNPAEKNYNLYELNFYSGDNPQLLFYVGLYGNGRDSWVQVDDVVVSCFTRY